MSIAKRTRRSARRRGISPIEVTLALSVTFVTAGLMYLIALRAFAALYQIMAIHLSSPYG